MSNKFRSKTRHNMIAMGKQRVLDNYVSVPYSPVYILVNNCFSIPFILQKSIIWMAGLGLDPGAGLGLIIFNIQEIFNIFTRINNGRSWPWSWGSGGPDRARQRGDRLPSPPLRRLPRAQGEEDWRWNWCQVKYAKQVKPSRWQTSPPPPWQWEEQARPQTSCSEPSTRWDCLLFLITFIKWQLLWQKTMLIPTLLLSGWNRIGGKERQPK